ncbi:hypothetical protein FHX57_006798 [Paraburkholderia tropica]|nr:hypothetical protein [Paraburkholderia tropica]MBB3004416.1 hypothetical protein [Paraburkholderia tropica]
MPEWTYWAAAIAVADALILLFFRGADDRSDIPEKCRRARTLSWKD